MVEEEEYGTLAWFQKYEPEAVEVAFPAGYAAGYAACKADVVEVLGRELDEWGSGVVANVIRGLLDEIEAKS